MSVIITAKDLVKNMDIKMIKYKNFIEFIIYLL